LGTSIDHGTGHGVRFTLKKKMKHRRVLERSNVIGGPRVKGELALLNRGENRGTTMGKSLHRR